jgi:hypothetical protein
LAGTELAESCSRQQTFLGLSHSIARWHVTNDGTQREQPPNSEVMQKMVVVAPHYTGSRTLDGEAEAEGLARLERHSAVALRTRCEVYKQINGLEKAGWRNP